MVHIALLPKKILDKGPILCFKKKNFFPRYMTAPLVRWLIQSSGQRFFIKNHKNFLKNVLDISLKM